MYIKKYKPQKGTLREPMGDPPIGFLGPTLLFTAAGHERSEVMALECAIAIDRDSAGI